MNEKHIEEIKSILTNWNPLGDQSYKVEDLNNYQTEAVDILFYIDRKSSLEKINKIMTEVIYQAFGVYSDLKDTVKYAKMIQEILKKN